MNALFTVLTILVLIASVLITLIVLLQNGKGGGLASNFVAGNQTFGVRQTTDILEKITWGLVAFIFVVSIVTSFALSNKAKEIDLTEKIEMEAPAPEFPAALPEAEVPAEAPAETPAN
ncbi:MAG: preprotein translocase subunit SecG [Bacteroidales bacterium]|jgi:preprotein translocase subunit SecG|nr:preprotein translocase subunit SecG [Bacteroidales bacterium]